MERAKSLKSPYMTAKHPSWAGCIGGSVGGGVGGGGGPHVPLPNSEAVVRAPSTQMSKRELQPHSPAQSSEHKMTAQPCGCGVGGAVTRSVGGG